MMAINPWWEGAAALISFLLPGLALALLVLVLQGFLSKVIRPWVWKGLWIFLTLKLLVPAGIWSPLESMVQWGSRQLWDQFSREALTLPESQGISFSSVQTDSELGTAAVWLRDFPKAEFPTGLQDFPLDVVSLIYFLGLTLSLAFFGARILSARFLVLRAVEDKTPRLSRLLQESSLALSYRESVRILVSDLCPGPASWGFGKPAVLLPRDFGTLLSDQELQNVFLHEVAHLKSRDPWTLLILDLACAVLWFHPAAWIIHRNLKLTLEHQADRLSLEVPSAPSPLDYGRTLISVLSFQTPGPFLPGSKAIAGSPGELKNRIKKIKDFAPIRSRIIQIGTFVLLGFLLAGTKGRTDVPRLPPMNYHRDGFYRYADVLMEEMEWDKAAQVYRFILDREPRSEGAASNLARILMSQGQYTEALSTLEEVELHDPWSWITSAQLKDILGRREEAMREYTFILSELNPQDSIRRLAFSGLDHPLPSRKALPFSRVQGTEIPSSEKAIRSGTGSWKAKTLQTHSLHPLTGAFDGDPDTRWSTQGNMAPGDAFVLELDRIRNLTAIVLVDDAEGRTIFTNDYPRKWTLEISPDGNRWNTVGRGEGEPDIYVGAAFSTQPVKLIRITQKGRSDAELWSIYEIRLWE